VAVDGPSFPRASSLASDVSQGESASPDGLGLLAYRRFRTRLFARALPVGEVLTQAELAELLGVPRTPLRDAIRTLQAEGLVEILPRSGIRIPRPDNEKVRQAFGLRKLLEREAARRAAEQAPRSAILAWRTQHAAMRADLPELTEDAQRERLTELDVGFHAGLVAMLRNRLIATIYRQTDERIILYRLDRSYVLTTPLILHTLAEHEAVLAAIAARDADAAGAAMDRHMDAALARALGA
jgi:DNA-binding GntR family transcriptional regulator